MKGGREKKYTEWRLYYWRWADLWISKRTRERKNVSKRSTSVKCRVKYVLYENGDRCVNQKFTIFLFRLGFVAVYHGSFGKYRTVKETREKKIYWIIFNTFKSKVGTT